MPQQKPRPATLKAAELYLSGMSSAEAAERFGIAKDGLESHLRRKGLFRSPRQAPEYTAMKTRLAEAVQDWSEREARGERVNMFELARQHDVRPYSLESAMSRHRILNGRAPRNYYRSTEVATLEQVGVSLNISRERVRQLEDRIEAKLVAGCKRERIELSEFGRAAKVILEAETKDFVWRYTVEVAVAATKRVKRVPLPKWR